MAVRGRDVDRARHVAVRTYQAHLADQQRRSIVLKAIEVRLDGPVPDVSLHVESGSITQGGHIFFVQDLQPEAERPKTVL